MAPFKFRFSKMGKSRSKGSRSDSSEYEDVGSSLDFGGASNPGTPGTEFNVMSLPNEPQTPLTNSPPPSYEHVLQETQLRRTPSEVEEGEEEVSGEGEASLVGNKIIVKGPEILHKSSKELYRAIAKQCGITCKMSDQCRCLDCQSHYFDCEYDKDELEKTDGGLGAGTPMFIAEVMHGTACVLL
ncbi:GSCOCG00002875001-RA-CDS [Cotesia congregata]|nr:GSCOCG00002875001-RA-CDS [Cotesia congregata]